MDKIPSKTYQYGDTKVKIVSPLVNMKPQERYEWFESEWEKGNPVLRDIVDAATDCFMDN
ncbi:hypothetical protein CN330_24245 [Priestia megaterium]|uniref:hypothetical protein n=1 Tax=Priestia megaterium TaxID=1404 RepID=UPI000BFA0078|nr:hypothetical protein [Priestia megaterium]PEZ08329.1 hypothetical protein CN330_24245 [Priestia megaterium]